MHNLYNENLHGFKSRHRSCQLSPSTLGAIKSARRSYYGFSQERKQKKIVSRFEFCAADKLNSKRFSQQNSNYKKIYKENSMQSIHGAMPISKKAASVAKLKKNSSLNTNSICSEFKKLAFCRFFYLLTASVKKFFNLLFFKFFELVELLASKFQFVNIAILNIKKCSTFTKCSCVVCVFVIFLVCYLYVPLRELYCQLRERERLNTELELIKNANTDIRQEINNLQTTEGIEDYVRKHLGWIKEGDNGVLITGLSQDQTTKANLRNKFYNTQNTWYSDVLDCIFDYRYTNK